MKEKFIRNIFDAIRGKNTENYNEQLRQKKEVLSYFYEMVEYYGTENVVSVTTRHDFDKLVKKQTLILTNEGRQYNLSMHMDHENTRHLEISNHDIKKRSKRIVKINEIAVLVNRNIEVAYLLTEANKYEKTGSSKHIETSREPLSSKELNKFLDEVYEAKHNPDFPSEVTNIDVFPAPPEKN